MITDRTISDVNIALTLRKKVQAGQTLTNAEKQAIERGTCTNVMLNRIEDKQAELMDILNEYSYMVHITNKTDWSPNDIFTNQDHARLLNNLDILKNAYYTYTSTPNTPIYIYNFISANNVEKILLDIENMIADMEDNFKQCGNAECEG